MSESKSRDFTTWVDTYVPGIFLVVVIPLVLLCFVVSGLILPRKMHDAIWKE